MENLNTVITGVKKYLDSELLTKITGINKWIVGAGLSMALDNAPNYFNTLKVNPVIKTMEVINQDDEIDVEKLYKYFYEQAKKSAVTFSLPLIGAVTLKADDVDKIYTFIMERKK